MNCAAEAESSGCIEPAPWPSSAGRAAARESFRSLGKISLRRALRALTAIQRDALTLDVTVNSRGVGPVLWALSISTDLAGGSLTIHPSLFARRQRDLSVERQWCGCISPLDRWSAGDIPL